MNSVIMSTGVCKASDISKLSILNDAQKSPISISVQKASILLDTQKAPMSPNAHTEINKQLTWYDAVSDIVATITGNEIDSIFSRADVYKYEVNMIYATNSKAKDPKSLIAKSLRALRDSGFITFMPNDIFTLTKVINVDIGKTTMEKVVVVPEYKIETRSYTKAKIPQIVRSHTWLKWMGRKFDAKCYACGVKDIDPFNFECGHIEAEKFGGETTLDNLRPICSGCNRSIGVRNMIDFVKEFGFKDSPLYAQLNDSS